MQKYFASDSNVLISLQSLRGIASLLVFLFHASFLIHEPWLNFIVKNGWIGVQIFFMISGFIMVHTTRNLKPDSANQSLKFMIRRIIRIAPLYYLCTLVYILPNLNTEYLLSNGKHLLYSIFFVSPLNIEKGPGYGNPVLDVGWTLNYEMLFYLVFAISILFSKYRYIFLLSFFAVFSVIIPLLMFGYLETDYLIYREFSWKFMNILTNPIMLNFVFGILMALILPKLSFSKLTLRILLILSILLFVNYFLGLTGFAINIVNDLLFSGFLVSACILNDFSSKNTGGWGPLVILGNISYSLYLIHPILIANLQWFFAKIFSKGFTENIAFFLFTITITLVIAWFMYNMIEKKFTIYLRKKLSV